MAAFIIDFDAWCGDEKQPIGLQWKSAVSMPRPETSWSMVSRHYLDMQGEQWSHRSTMVALYSHTPAARAGLTLAGQSFGADAGPMLKRLATPEQDGDWNRFHARCPFDSLEDAHSRLGMLPTHHVVAIGQGSLRDAPWSVGYALPDAEHLVLVGDGTEMVEDHAQEILGTAGLTAGPLHAGWDLRHQVDLGASYEHVELAFIPGNGVGLDGTPVQMATSAWMRAPDGTVHAVGPDDIGVHHDSSVKGSWEFHIEAKAQPQYDYPIVVGWGFDLAKARPL